MSRGKKRLRASVGILVSAALIALMLVRLNLAEVWSALSDVDRTWLMIAAVLGTVDILARASRWFWFLRPLVPARLRPTLAAYFVGNTANMLAPVRAGDVLRARLVAVHNDVATSRVFAAVAVERFLDVIVLLVAFWLTLSKVPAGDRMLGAILAVLATAGVVIGSLFLWRFSKHPSTESKIGRFMARHAIEFKEGLVAWGRSPRSVIEGVLWSVGAWAATLLAVWAALLSVNIHLSLLQVVLPVVLFQFVSVLPSGPAFVGTVQAVAIVSLKPFGVSAEDAVAGAIVYQAIFVVASLLTGAWGAWYQYARKKPAGAVGAAKEEEDSAGNS